MTYPKYCEAFSAIIDLAYSDKELSREDYKKLLRKIESDVQLLQTSEDTKPHQHPDQNPGE